MVFALQEYNAAAQIAFRGAIEALVPVIEPALRAFEVQQVESVPMGTVTTDAGDAIEFVPVRSTQEVSFDPLRAVAGDLEAVTESAFAAATRLAELRLSAMRRYLETLTDGTGQVVRVDREMNWDDIMRVVEGATISFDPAGEPTFTLWPPAALARYAALDPRTPEQEQRWQELMSTKWEEHRARQRDRRLR